MCLPADAAAQSLSREFVQNSSAGVRDGASVFVKSRVKSNVKSNSFGGDVHRLRSPVRVRGNYLSAVHRFGCEYPESAGGAVLGRRRLRGSSHGGIRSRYFLRKEYGMVSRCRRLQEDRHPGGWNEGVDKLPHARASAMRRTNRGEQGLDVSHRTSAIHSISY